MTTKNPTEIMLDPAEYARRLVNNDCTLHAILDSMDGKAGCAGAWRAEVIEIFIILRAAAAIRGV